jgi:hypothetical protein
MPKFDLLKKKTKNKKSIGNHFYRSNRSGYRSVYKKTIALSFLFENLNSSGK